MVYLKALESKLLQISSEWDITLYRFLHGQKHSLNVAKNDIETELCFNAFVDGNGDLPLSKLKKVKPFKGLHYTNNFVLLIAAAKVDPNGEEVNVRNYLSDHGYKEQLIINTALGKSYRITSKLDTPIDTLANLIEENKHIKEEDIQNCLTCASDIYDYFIIEKGVARRVFQLNEEINLETYKSIVLMQKRALRRVEFAVYFFIVLIFLYLLYLVIPTAIGSVVDNWSILEPYAFLIEKIGTIILIIMGVVLTTLVKTIKDSIKRLILRIMYWILGVKHSEYQKLKDIIKLE